MTEKQGGKEAEGGETEELQFLDLWEPEEGAEGEEESAQKAENRAEDSEWVTVLRVEELPPNTPKRVTLQGEEIALFNVDGRISALSNTCPHMDAYLGEGALEGEVVTCPWHGWQFNIRNGRCLNQPGRSVEIFEVRVRNGEIQIRR